MTGRYSKHLPERLASRYKEALGSTELLELRADIALLDTRVGELVGSLEGRDTAGAWDRLREALGRFQGARARQDTAGMAAAIESLESIVRGGVGDAVLWREIWGLLEQRRRLVESERKRLVDMQQMISTERTLVLMGAIVGIIREHVTDRTTLNAVSTDIRGLLCRGDSGRAA